MLLRHLIHFKDWTGSEILELLEKALHIKKNPQQYRDALKQKTLVMIFQKTSTRTRVSFEAGMTNLGGHAIFLDWRTSNFLLADIKDEVRYVSGNCDIIMARLMHHEDLLEMAEFSYVPVINGCDDRYHPTQAFADFLTIREKLGGIEGKKIVYVGVWNNTLNSLVDVSYKTGAHLVAITPVINQASWDQELVDAAEKSGFLKRSDDLKGEVKDADAVYTDSWVDMEFFLDPKFEEEKKRRIETMLPYQLNKANLQGSKALIMHDMPIHTGYEIDREAIEDGRSVIFLQGHNRMHGEVALVMRLLGVV